MMECISHLFSKNLLPVAKLVLEVWKNASTLKKVIASPFLLTGASWLMCKYRLYPANIFYTIHFGCTLSTTCLFFITAAFPSHILRTVGLMTHKSAFEWAHDCAWRACHYALKLNPQIKFHRMDTRDSLTEEWDGFNNNTLIYHNHTSMLDAFAVTAKMPIRMYRVLIGIMKSSLDKIPFLGPFFFERGLFHLKAYYTGHGYDDYSVDKEKQGKEMMKMAEWLRAGNCSSLAPEGRVSKFEENHIISPVRFGMLKLYYEHARNHKIAVMTFYTCGEAWALHEPFAGKPADIFLKIVAYKPPMCTEEEAKDPAVLGKKLANHVQEFMQNEVDEVAAARALAEIDGDI